MGAIKRHWSGFTTEFAEERRGGEEETSGQSQHIQKTIDNQPSHTDFDSAAHNKLRKLLKTIIKFSISYGASFALLCCTLLL